MSAACHLEGCTVGETGRCALEKDPITCSNRIDINAITPPPSTEAGDYSTDLGAPVLLAPQEAPAFPRSTSLGSGVIGQMMTSRYVTVIGILGDPASGKTACLASLYLLASNDLLTGWSFADSRSLMGFEDIARGARHWNEGKVPEQMTVHTELSDDREPGFLHLRLKRARDGKCVDFALPDLPGEWTKDLVRTARSDRFEFLKSADVLWFVVDGRTLHNLQQRQGVISRLGQLAGRLRALIQDGMPKMILVLTHRDEMEVPEAVIVRIHTELAKHACSASVMVVASFSGNNAFKPGHGLSDLLDASTASLLPAPPFWPNRTANKDVRAFICHRREP